MNINTKALEIQKNIYKIEIPFMDVFTTVFVVSTKKGVLLFDAACVDKDADEYILPALEDLNIDKDNLKYIFLSHNHGDHSGALGRLVEIFPNVTIVSLSAEIKEQYSGFNVLCPNDGDLILDCLKVVTIPGHSVDSMAIFDIRTNTLLSGDCLQQYGLYGCCDWGTNIGLPVKYLEAVQKVREIEVENLYNAHEYHPCGLSACGKDEVSEMLDKCVEAVEKVKELVLENPSKTDGEIVDIYNNSQAAPRIFARVVCAVREAITEGKM